jgi:hypothetical protein
VAGKSKNTNKHWGGCVYSTREASNHKTKKLREGALVRVHSSQDIRILQQSSELGHLEDVGLYGDPVVGVVTKLWPYGYGGREFEMLSSGIFFILSSNNGFEIDEIEVLS